MAYEPVTREPIAADKVQFFAEQAFENNNLDETGLGELSDLGVQINFKAKGLEYAKKVKNFMTDEYPDFWTSETAEPLMIAESNVHQKVINEFIRSMEDYAADYDLDEVGLEQQVAQEAEIIDQEIVFDLTSAAYDFLEGITDYLHEHNLTPEEATQLAKNNQLLV